MTGDALADANKLNHIFGNTEHGLGGVVEQLGSQQSAFGAIRQATQNAAAQRGLTGVFETTVQVAGETITPSGQTIGQLVQNSLVDIASAAGPYDIGGVGEFGAFLATVQSKGPIDLKNNLRGTAPPAFLGAAGNFAYGAIASGIGYSQGVAEFGAGVYAIKAGKPTPGNPFFEDNSAAQNLPAGYASFGCTK